MSDGDRSGFVTMVYFWQIINSLKNQIANIPSGGGSLTAVTFSAPSVSVANLSGKIPDEQFIVFGGTGLIKLNNGYTFSGDTITVDPNSGEYTVVY